MKSNTQEILFNSADFSSDFPLPSKLETIEKVAVRKALDSHIPGKENPSLLLDFSFSMPCIFLKAGKVLGLERTATF